MGRHREFDTSQALDAALSVFWDKGYEGTSYEDLTRVTGVARPGLYSAFGNKESLFRTALDRYEARHLAFMSDALKAPTAREAVRQILEGSVALQTLADGNRGCLGVTGALAGSDESEPVRQELIARRKATENALHARLQTAKQEGELPASADCAMLATYVMTLNQGMAVQAKAGASREALEAMVRYALSTWPS